MDKTTRISFYSSIFFSIFIITLDICYLILFANPNPWVNFEKYVANYKLVEVLPEIIGFILLPTFVITISGIILNNHIENTHTARISNFFAIAFVIIVSVGYFIQFAVVYPNIHAENNKIYELWLFGNTEGSLAWGSNYLGWFWSGLSTFFIAFNIKDKAVKVLFITYGILLCIAFIGYCVRNAILQAVLGLAWFIILPAAFLRVTYLFNRIIKNELQQI